MDKISVLLFGATGMAGHVIYYYLQSTGKYMVNNVVFRNKLTDDSIVVDVTDKDKVVRVIREVRPQFIINCVGVLVKGSREFPDQAIYINAYFPHLLKKTSDEVGAKLVHISTDCVFSGKKGNYTEYDFRDADDIYGRSKALGEIINDKDLTIRTSIIGPELKTNGEGLFHWFMKQQGEVNGFTSAYWGGVTTLELAKAIDVAIGQKLTGLVQLSNGIKITKYELLLLFKRIWDKKNIAIRPFSNDIIDKSIARSERFDYQVPAYEEMLLEQYRWMNYYREMYIQYYD